MEIEHVQYTGNQDDWRLTHPCGESGHVFLNFFVHAESSLTSSRLKALLKVRYKGRKVQRTCNIPVIKTIDDKPTPVLKASGGVFLKFLFVLKVSLSVPYTTQFSKIDERGEKYERFVFYRYLKRKSTLNYIPLKICKKRGVYEHPYIKYYPKNIMLTVFYLRLYLFGLIAPKSGIYRTLQWRSEAVSRPGTNNSKMPPSLTYRAPHTDREPFDLTLNLSL